MQRRRGNGRFTRLHVTHASSMSYRTNTIPGGIGNKLQIYLLQ